MVQLSHLYLTTGKTIALTRWTFVGKIVSLLFITLSRFIIAFLPRSIFKFHGCSYEIKRCLVLGRKSMTILDSALKTRDITLLTKVYIVKAMVFPVVMCRCVSWTIKMAGH